MPRNGDGSSDNGPIEGHTIAVGAGGSEPESSIVDRASKTAPMPEFEKGDAVEGMNASGGGSTGIGGHTGQGRPIDPEAIKVNDGNKP
ncbi:hypothetical protein K402DRAFT_392936 [Aulographum hederae CBS 113979]|uniref:Uncharacterized protein n=1 Tax=Aulographum hederae CBS 113979 TaxID=1176131 RepID=A0A6G1H2P9_9PEZI|nr:hypothetical protein K402DRAFT_392936 [Aulographum hederae CBS 113979]